MKTTITEYEVVDHGIEGSQYFQGCGVAYTSFDYVATGCGNDFTEALEDALESVAQGGADVSTIEAANEQGSADTVPEDSDDVYYYVSVRWNEQEVE